MRTLTSARGKKIESTPRANQINNRKNPLIIVFLSQYGFLLLLPSTFWKSIWIYEYYILPRVYILSAYAHAHTFRQFSESYLVLEIYHSDIHHPVQVSEERSNSNSIPSTISTKLKTTIIMMNAAENIPNFQINI